MCARLEKRFKHYLYTIDGVRKYITISFYDTGTIDVKISFLEEKHANISDIKILPLDFESRFNQFCKSRGAKLRCKIKEQKKTLIKKVQKQVQNRGSNPKCKKAMKTGAKTVASKNENCIFLPTVLWVGMFL